MTANLPEGLYLRSDLWSPTGVSDELLRFKSHVKGKNADVVIYPDRVEWSRKAMLRGGQTEMIPMRSITSVSSGRDGLANHKVTLSTAAGAIELRCSKGDAEKARTTIQQLMLA